MQGTGTEQAIESLLRHCVEDSALQNDENINLIVQFQKASDLKSPIGNVALNKFRKIPIIVSIPHKLNKNVRDLKILMITKNPSNVYIEKLRACDKLLPENEHDKLAKRQKNMIYAKTSWRDSENLQTVVKNYKPKVKTAQDGQQVITDTAEIQKNKSTFLDTQSDSSELFSKIISLKQFKSICKTREFTKLVKEHDYIMADHRILGDISKYFPDKSRKQPFIIKMSSSLKKRKELLKNHNNLNTVEKATLDPVEEKYVYSQIKSIIRNSSTVLPSIVTTIDKYDSEKKKNSSGLELNFIIGKISTHSPEQLLANIKVLQQYVNDNLLQKMCAINGMFVKTDNSQSLPIAL